MIYSKFPRYVLHLKTNLSLVALHSVTSLTVLQSYAGFEVLTCLTTKGNFIKSRDVSQKMVRIKVIYGHLESILMI
jgi:hypothetical protein